MSSSVWRSARLISLLTLVSRIVGLGRDMACAAVFGAGGVMSAFTVAFQIPNLFRGLFGEGALTAASIPVLTEKLTLEGPEVVDAVAGRLIGLLVAVLVAVCLVGEGLVGGLYWYQHSDSQAALTLSLTALMLPYVLLVCTVALLSGVQNVLGQFALPAMMPIILNLFMIAGALGGRWAVSGSGTRDLQKERAIFFLAWAVMVSGMVQVVWQWWRVRGCGFRLRMRLDIKDPSVRRIVTTMLPMMAGLGAVQVNTLVGSLIALWFVREPTAPGLAAEPVGPAILSFAQRLYQFPLGVFAIALATAIFPTLSRHAAQNDLPGLGRTLTRGMRLASFEALPCLVGLILIREPLVRVLYGRGEFSKFAGADVRVAFTVSMYALGIWAYALNHLMVRAFYAMQNAKTPLRVSVVNVFLNLGLNLWLVNTWMLEAGLALATSICAFVQVGTLMVLFHRRIGHIQWANFTGGVARMMLAVGVMAGTTLAVDHYAAGDMRSAMRLILLVLAGGCSFLAAAWVLRCRELREVFRR